MPNDRDARLLAVEEFRGWLNGYIPRWQLRRQNILTGLYELRGKDLACWCPLDQPCHADVLLELANQGESPNE
jgi:hypothetical protein